MMDVTYLNDRDKGHPDFATFKGVRTHVTLKMLARPEFQNATETQQEIYILRLARQVHHNCLHVTSATVMLDSSMT